MAEYLAFRIMEKALDYALVVAKRPDLKEQIDAILIQEKRAELIK